MPDAPPLVMGRLDALVRATLGSARRGGGMHARRAPAASPRAG
jgi:hypothetical protein